VTGARDQTISKGIIIIGLLIINDRLQPSGCKKIAGLDKYYTAFVIGDPGAFIVVTHDFKDFARDAGLKPVFEIANISPPEFTSYTRVRGLKYKAVRFLNPAAILVSAACTGAGCLLTIFRHCRK